MKKYFWILTLIIILFGFLIRIYPLLDNRIFFTVDQGRDAIYVREILNFHKIFTKGPQSSVAGIFTGPGWYYFISAGYAIFKGNPIGAVFMLIVLNLGITLLLMGIIKNKVSWKLALITGLGLQFFWGFYTTSLWGFNPFPLVCLSIILIILLIKKRYVLALIPIFLAFNTELAGATAFLIFYALIGAWWVLKKKLDLPSFVICAIGLPLMGILKIVNDFLNQPVGATRFAGLGVFNGVNFGQMAIEFGKMLGQAAIPQNPYLGLGIIILIIVIFVKRKKKNLFIKNFVFLSLGLIITSYFFFSSNLGWRAWHTVYIPPLIFISLTFMLYEFKRIGYFLIGIIFVLQIINFKDNVTSYLKPTNNPSLLSNQLKVLDWVYSHNEGNGFNLYTYTNTFYDYSYQYLVSWYGKPKYGFYPCEYSNFPISNKDLYMPGWQHYVEPQLGCDDYRFLIVESDTNGNENKNWINEFRIETHLIDSFKIGDTLIEKRKTRDIY